MVRLVRIIMLVTYILGLSSIALAFGVRYIPAIARTVEASFRGGLDFAATLFLCSLASHFVGEVIARE